MLISLQFRIVAATITNLSLRQVNLSRIISYQAAKQALQALSLPIPIPKVTTLFSSSAMEATCRNVSQLHTETTSLCARLEKILSTKREAVVSNITEHYIIN